MRIDEVLSVAERKRRKAPTHRTTIDLNDGRDSIPAGTLVREVPGSANMYVLVKVPAGMHGVYKIDTDCLEPL
jgi:hypothetical protein